MWLWNYSKGELRISYLDKPYIITCNHYQMLVLLQFNDSELKSLDDLVATTSLENDIVLQVLENFAKPTLRFVIQDGPGTYRLNLSEQQLLPTTLLGAHWAPVDWKSSKVTSPRPW